MAQIVFIIFLACLAAALSAIGSAHLRKDRQPQYRYSIVSFAVIAVSGGLLSCFTQVSQSHVGIVTTFGHVEEDTLGEGPHLVNPVSRVHEVFIGLDVAKVQSAQAASKDLQSVHTDLTMNYRVDPAKVRALYSMAPSLEYEASYVQPAMFEVFKSVAARYTAEELVTKRQQVSSDILAGLVTKLKGYGFLIQDINITNFKFSAAFDQAIEAKVTASQRAEQAERELARVKFEADQQIAKARGEAESIAIQAQAVKTNGGAEYLQLQAINKWDGRMPTYMGTGTPMPFLNVSK
ncbi:bacteriophage/transposase fusion protein [Caballeronia fortuita]|uniref:Bacteriophage/transposase fusion protein n=1 Tax=Caballeronia fortuita TaxID=1777138 RepID=A0A158D2D6_9BURK|nr:prohibitin family protein [Caballeronia fortuita]SAK88772.1 bacteriophage/transposase fusion protein [Caballeronia fortuita]